MDKCGSGWYNSKTQFCQAGTNAVLPLCGTATFTSTEFCQAGTNAVLPLCGSTATFTSTEFCQAGTNTVLSLCGSLPYEATQFCHNSKIGDFCGTRTETFDPDLYECKTGDKIYLKSGLTDSRDNNKHYEAVLIGTQTWMAENLNYRTPDGDSRCYPTSGTTNASDADEGRCGTYGRLYKWATALAINASCNTSTVASCGAAISPKHQGICPSGWHIPSDAEWTALTTFVGSNPGTKLKANSTLWSTNTGTDEFGFSALPGGSSGGPFEYVGDRGYWWSASESDANNAYCQFIYHNYGSAFHDNNRKMYWYSVRCLQD
jgi:uncharacterized protein (TIGR02145 family)